MARRSFGRRHAFTLIELLVVVVILAILMAIAIPAYLAQQDKARDAKAKQYLAYAYRAIRSNTPQTNNQFPTNSSMVSWVQQSEPELSVTTGSCYAFGSIAANTVVVDNSSTSSNLLLCAKSDSGNVWKLAASPTSAPSFTDGTLVPLTVSGNEITDTTRAANVQGDGLQSDSSTGIWESTTNLCPNGGFESNTTGWITEATHGADQTAISSDSSHAKFGTNSLKMVTNGLNTNEGVDWATAAYASVTPSATYAGSMWVYSSAGGEAMQDYILGYTSNTTNSASQVISSSRYTLAPGWQELTLTGTLNANILYASFVLRTAQGVAPQAITVWMDGVQFEQKNYPTPYVETNGAAGSRSSARVQAPVGLINGAQMWFVARVRLGFGSTVTRSQVAGVFDYENNTSNRLRIYLHATNRWYVERWSGGSTTRVSTAVQTFSAGDVETIIGYFTATQIGVSLNGAPFLTASNAFIPTLSASQFDIGSGGAQGELFDGAILWAAVGTGTLSDADAATINAFGSTDPKVASFPSTAQATMVWNGEGATGSLK